MSTKSCTTKYRKPTTGPQQILDKSNEWSSSNAERRMTVVRRRTTVVEHRVSRNSAGSICRGFIVDVFINFLHNRSATIRHIHNKPTTSCTTDPQRNPYYNESNQWSLSVIATSVAERRTTVVRRRTTVLDHRLLVTERRMAVVGRRQGSGGPLPATSRSPGGRSTPVAPSSSFMAHRVAHGRQLRPQQTVRRRRRLTNERQSRHLPNSR